MANTGVVRMPLEMPVGGRLATQTPENETHHRHLFMVEMYAVIGAVFTTANDWNRRHYQLLTVQWRFRAFTSPMRHMPAVPSVIEMQRATIRVYIRRRHGLEVAAASRIEALRSLWCGNTPVLDV